MPEAQDTTLLHRRARRRLVGAIALVVFVVIFLPIVLDKEPKPIGQDLVIQIPSQDSGRFNTRVLPPGVPSTSAASPGTNERPASESKAAPGKDESQTRIAESPARPDSGKDAVKPLPVSEKAAPDKTSEQAAEAAGADRKSDRSSQGPAESYVVPVGSYGSPENARRLQAKLAGAGVKVFTDIVKGPKGEQTRVRAGPFESKGAAESAREKLKAMNVPVGAVAPL